MTRHGAEKDPPGGWGEVFGAAFRLGLGSFGGPTAHIGYFERDYVQRRKWLSADDFAGLVALCQFVPGPTSSQVGMLVGLRRAGPAGALAAWLGFTMPSALAMAAFALVLQAGVRLSPPALDMLHGLKLVAVAIVAQAVWTMARSLCPDARRRIIAIAGLVIVLATGGQWAALVAGGVLGSVVCGRQVGAAIAPAVTVPRRVGVLALGAFVGLLALAGGAMVIGLRGPLGLAAILYQAGALVFGGGHVVLPLLRRSLVPGGWLDDQTFLAGYGAAQALPGPLFALAGYLGVACARPGAGWWVAMGWSGGALIAMFLPGMLLATGALPVWQWIGRHSRAQGALAGVNAAVVGVLAAALYDPVARTALIGPADIVIALAGLALLMRWRAPPLGVVALIVAATVLVGIAGR